jgi:uncharacterized membrane protein
MATDAPERKDFEAYPLTRQEYISAMVHLYRGELNRANTWRIRLDTSTNWAVLASTGLLSFAFGSREHSHASILVGMLLVLHFLMLESRRYRIFDVWRHRLRMIEENFYGPILTRDLASRQSQWGRLVAADLLKPCFKITYLQAFRNRLVHNYAMIFLVLLGAWIAKVMSAEVAPGTSALSRLGVGPVSGILVLVLVAAIYLFLGAVMAFAPHASAEEATFWKAGEKPRGWVDF